MQLFRPWNAWTHFFFCQTIDFACVETQIGEAENAMDCEVLELAAVGMDIPAVTVPPL